MDSKTLFLVIAASVLFVVVILWKVVWFLKMMNSENPKKNKKH